MVLFSIFAATKTICAYSLVWDNGFGPARQAIKLSNLGARCIYSFKLSGATGGAGRDALEEAAVLTRDWVKP